MPDTPEPPRKFYKFKPKEFENVNGVQRGDLDQPGQPAADPGVIRNEKVPIDIRDLLRSAHAHEESPAPSASSPPESAAPPVPGRIEVRDLNRIATAGQPALTKNRPREETEIHATLRDNHARADAAGLNEVTPRERRPSRRKRDYLAALLLGNAALIVGTMLNPVFGAAGLIIYNVGVTWIMWFVMDDY